MATVSYGFWNDVLETLQRRDPTVARAWFRLLKPGTFHGGVLCVYAANPQQHEYLQQHAGRAFTDAVQSLTGRLVSVRFDLLPDQQNESSNETSADAELAVSWGPTPLAPDSTFDEFVVGPCNRLAEAAAAAVADSPGRVYNPFFLYGAPGTGKSHLLQAVCHRTIASHPRVRCIYVRAEQFSTAFLATAESDRQDDFRRYFREADLLAVDDVHRLSERERSQEEFFYTFNALRERGAQVVLSADRPPSELGGLQDRLTSRFNSGLVTALDPPCYETRLAILRKKCKLRCLEIPADALEFVAARIDASPRHLEQALLKIDSLAQTFGGAVTLEIARQAIGDVPRPWISLPAIVEVVQRRFGVRCSDLAGPLRKRAFTVPRQICMYLARHLTQHSLQDIGDFFGHRDHSTVLHSIRLVARQTQESPEFRRLMEELWQELMHAASAPVRDVLPTLGPDAEEKSRRLSAC